MTATQLVTADELYQMGSDAPYELWEGVLKEDLPSGIRVGVLSARIVIAVFNYVDDRQLGYVTSASAGYVLSQHPATVIAPSLGFVHGDRFPDGLPKSGFCPIPPDLAVEVISPSDRKSDIAEKQELYRRAGVPLVWWVDPEQKIVTVYRLGQAPEVVTVSGVLDGGAVLPGFKLALRTIFRD